MVSDDSSYVTARGSAKRRSGIWLVAHLRNADDSGWVIGVSIQPAQMAFTRMFREATSRATERVNDRMPSDVTPVGHWRAACRLNEGCLGAVARCDRASSRLADLVVAGAEAGGRAR